ncbi:MAG: SIMPL domain-containing protein, partial [Pseudomonadota bacterium]
ARRRAALNAKSRAALLAEALDVDIVGVLSIAEHGGTSPRRPQMMAMADAAMESRAMPVAAGESTLSATVSVTYEIADK